MAESAADRAEDTAERNQRLQEVQNASPGATIKDAASASDAALADAIAAQEQRDGAKVLDDLTPQSQSAQAAAKRAEAKLE